MLTQFQYHRDNNLKSSQHVNKVFLRLITSTLHFASLYFTIFFPRIHSSFQTQGQYCPIVLLVCSYRPFLIVIPPANTTC